MNLHFFIAKRYCWHKKSRHAVHLISWISMLSVAVCTAALIIILSVFNGLEELIMSMYNEAGSDLRIIPKQGKTIFLSDSAQTMLNQNIMVKNYAPVIETSALIQSDQTQFICTLRGIDTNYMNKNFALHNITKGNYFTPSTQHPNNEIIVSDMIARGLGIDIDLNPSQLMIYNLPLENPSLQLDQSLSQNLFFTIGTYSIHKDIDAKVCFVPLHILKNITQCTDQQYSFIDIYIHTKYQNDLNNITQQLRTLFNNEVDILTLAQQNKSMYAILSTERLSIILILTFIILIASFNLSGSVCLLIMEKKDHLMLFKVMGYTRRDMQKIFLYSGLIYGCIGLIIGLILGTLICLVQYYWHLVPIQGAGFMIHYFPVRLAISDYILTTGIVVFISFMASFYALYKLRNEFKPLLKKI